MSFKTQVILLSMDHLYKKKKTISLHKGFIKKFHRKNNEHKTEDRL